MSELDPEPQGDASPSRNEIRAQLKHMLADPAFSSADRLSRLLRYLVEKSSANALQNLKEYTVGLEVFDRGPDFDPRTDSVVRVHGSRLRARLDEYYRTSGQLDPVVIALPKGSYVVTFSYRAERSARLVAMPPPPPASEISEVEPAPRSEEHASTAASTTKPSRLGRRTAAVSVGTAAILVTAYIAWRAFMPSKVAPAILVSPLTTLPGDEWEPSVSPDGSQVVFSWAGKSPDEWNLYLTVRGSGSVRRLTNGPGSARYPAWSPDGRFIAFTRRDKDVLLISPLGGAERKLIELGPIWFVSWTPDSQSLLVAGNEPGQSKFDLYLVSIATGEKHRLTGQQDDVMPYEPYAISPSGQWLAFAQQAAVNARPQIFVRPVNGGPLRRLTSESRFITGWTWTPDSRAILVSSKRNERVGLWRVAVSGGDVEPRPIPEAGSDCRYPAMALRSERPVLVCEQHELDMNLRELRLEAGRSTVGPAQSLLVSTRVESSPQISPDGSRIAFVSDRSGYEEIWASESDGGNPQLLTALGPKGDLPGSPRWSPDSRQIVFDVTQAVHRQIFVAGVEASGVRRLTAWPSDQSRPSWSRDGRWIYFGSNRTGRYEVWKAPSTGSGEVTPEQCIQLTHDSGFEAYESEDGKLVYFVPSNKSRSLRSIPAGGGISSAVIDDGIFHGWWALARGGVYFANLLNSPKAIWFYDLNTGSRTRIGSLPDSVNKATPDFCVSRDGRRLIYGEIERSNTDLKLLENVN